MIALFSRQYSRAISIYNYIQGARLGIIRLLLQISMGDSLSKSSDKSSVIRFGSRSTGLGSDDHARIRLLSL